MKKFFTERKLNIIISVAAIVAMWLAWLALYYATGNEYIVPSFWETCRRIGKYFADGAFWIAFLNTFVRTMLAFLLSFAVAAVLAAVGAVFPKFATFIKPVMVFFRTLPTLAVILILLVWTTRVIAPVAVTFLVLFPMIYAQFCGAIGEIDCGVKEALRVYGVPAKERLFKVYLPLISPAVFSQTGANISLGIKIMISAEVLAKTYKSIGGLMQDARIYFDNMAGLAALTVISVLLGLVVDIAFSQISRINSKWHKENAKC